MLRLLPWPLSLFLFFSLAFFLSPCPLWTLLKPSLPFLPSFTFFSLLCFFFSTPQCSIVSVACGPFCGDVFQSNNTSSYTSLSLHARCRHLLNTTSASVSPPVASPTQSSTAFFSSITFRPQSYVVVLSCTRFPCLLSLSFRFLVLGVSLSSSTSSFLLLLLSVSLHLSSYNMHTRLNLPFLLLLFFLSLFLFQPPRSVVIPILFLILVFLVLLVHLIFLSFPCRKHSPFPGLMLMRVTVSIPFALFWGRLWRAVEVSSKLPPPSPDKGVSFHLDKLSPFHCSHVGSTTAAHVLLLFFLSYSSCMALFWPYVHFLYYCSCLLSLWMFLMVSNNLWHLSI